MSSDLAEIRLRLLDARQTRARYGRATLSIARWGALREGSVWEAVRTFEKEELTADDLCWTFVRSRVIGHSPSFTWENADLEKVLRLVTTASQEPEIPNLAPVDLAPVLVEMAREEWERCKALNEKILKAVRPTLPAFFGQSNIQKMMNLGASSAFDQFVGGSSRLDRVTDFMGTKGIAGELTGFTAWKASTLASDAITATMPLGRRQWAFTGKEFPSAAQRLALGGFGASGTVKVAQALEHVSPTFSIFDQLDLGSKFFGAGAMEERFSGLVGHSFQLPPGLLGHQIAGDGLRHFGKQWPWFEKQTGIMDLLSDQQERWSEMFKRALPRNWRELTDQEVDQVAELMAATGLGLAWAPRPEILRELLIATGYAARCRVLEANASAVVQDAEEVLEEIEREDLAPTVNACRRAVATHRAGFVEPAQAYLGTALTDLVHGFFGAKGFKDVRDVFGDVNPRDDVGMGRFSLFVVGLAWVRAIDHMKNAGDDFNRNLTLHRLGAHYNDANFLAALTLLAGLARELQRAGNRHDREQSELAAA